MSPSPMCDDRCRHCCYLGSGAFYCDITNTITIVDWERKQCVCPDRKEFIK